MGDKKPLLLTNMEDISNVVISNSEWICKVCGGPGVDLHHIVYGNGRQRTRRGVKITITREISRVGVYGERNKSINGWQDL